MSSDDVTQLRADLLDADYSVDTLGQLWGEASAAALHRGQRLPALRDLEARGGRNQSAAATLAAAFVLGLPVTRPALEHALPRLGIARSVALGLVAEENDLLRPLIDLRPYSFVDGNGVGSWWIASDLGELATGRALDENHVLGIGGASLTLSGLMIGESVTSVLDLGTGCGIQALHASRFADHVVATDISERALAFAQFNASLNEATNIEFRLGSLYEPVEGEEFDLIVSNPPFVITPRSANVPSYEYRDGGLVGDLLVQEVVRGAADHLRPGGIAQLLGNWEYLGGADGLDRVSDWTDLDLWVIEREQQDAALYAETWIRDGGTVPGTAAFDALYSSWLDDFAQRGVTSVGFGYLTLINGDRSFRRVERIDGALGHNASGLGEHIAAVIRAHEWLSSHELASSRLIVASDVTEERHYWPGEEHPTVMRLHQGGGFGRTESLDTALAGFVGACDGELTVRAIIGALSQLLEADEQALTTELLPRVRELFATGFIHA